MLLEKAWLQSSRPSIFRGPSLFRCHCHKCPYQHIDRVVIFKGLRYSAFLSYLNLHVDCLWAISGRKTTVFSPWPVLHFRGRVFQITVKNMNLYQFIEALQRVAGYYMRVIFVIGDRVEQTNTPQHDDECSTTDRKAESNTKIYNMRFTDF